MVHGCSLIMCYLECETNEVTLTTLTNAKTVAQYRADRLALVTGIHEGGLPPVMA